MSLSDGTHKVHHSLNQGHHGVVSLAFYLYSELYYVVRLATNQPRHIRAMQQPTTVKPGEFYERLRRKRCSS